MPSLIVGALTAVLVLGTTACRSDARARDLVLATTTSVANSGLLEPLASAALRDNGLRLRSHLVGSGLALSMLASGDADVAITHAPETEAAALRAHPQWQ